MSLHLAAIKLRISGAKAECSRRGLGQTENWLSEISFDIRVRSFPRARKVLNWTHIISPSLTSTLKNMKEQPFY